MSRMKILKPTVLTEGMLTASTALEVAPAVYDPANVYAAGAVASISGVAGLVDVYESLQGGNVGHAPTALGAWWRWLCSVYQAYSTAATYAADDRVQDNAAHLVYQSVLGGTNLPLNDTTQWQLVGATNKWAAFDSTIGTATESATPLVMTMLAGPASGIGFVELNGQELHVVCKTAAGGTVIYDRIVNLDATPIESVFDWFFAEREQLGDVVLSDLPAQYIGMEITVTVRATSGKVGVGVCKPGKVSYVGITQQGASVGILDFSKKTRNDFGGVTLEEGAFSKRASYQVFIDHFSFNRIYRFLASLRGTPCFYVGTEAAGYEPFIGYGFYRDFSIAVPYADYHMCSLETEGLDQ
ncbi:MAG: hypothetical protein JWP29_4712 [Rhodoferax sp.]|nr:hypothetical protein [Rhodoferax sp.]